MKHTPTPWVLGVPNIPNAEYTEHVGISGPDDGFIFAEVFNDGLSPKGEVTANAKLIVRAVNSHADLLAAAKRVVDLLDSQYLRGNGDGGRVNHAFSQLNSAIAKAEGQP